MMMKSKNSPPKYYTAAPQRNVSLRNELVHYTWYHQDKVFHVEAWGPHSVAETLHGLRRHVIRRAQRGWPSGGEAFVKLGGEVVRFPLETKNAWCDFDHG
jgi:hypothetical protein